MLPNDLSKEEVDLMTQLFRILAGLAIFVMIFASPIVYFRYRKAHLRNFRVVREGVLYRSGQMTLAGVKRIVHDYGIRTVVTLRDARRKGDPPPDLAEEQFCKRHFIKHVRIPPVAWWMPDGSCPAEPGLRRFRKLMKNPANYPVLVHCFAGLHRAGGCVAIYRMEHEGWSNEDAIKEMINIGWEDLVERRDIYLYLKDYVPHGNGLRLVKEQPVSRFSRLRK